MSVRQRKSAQNKRANQKRKLLGELAHEINEKMQRHNQNHKMCARCMIQMVDMEQKYCNQCYEIILEDEQKIKPPYLGLSTDCSLKIPGIPKSKTFLPPMFGSGIPSHRGAEMSFPTLPMYSVRLRM